MTTARFLPDVKPGRAAVGRADLLRCIDAIGSERLDQVAPLTGYAAIQKGRTVEADLKLSVSLALAAAETAPIPKAAPIQPSEMPKASFYRVVEHNRRPVHESGREVPDLFKHAKPLGPWERKEMSIPAAPLLSAWSRLWPLLHSVLGSTWPTRRIDVERVVDDAARGRVLRRLPFRRKEGWSPVSQVLVDFDRRLMPFWEDFNRLCRALDKLRGRSGLEILAFENGPDGFCRQWRDRCREQKIYAPPEPGTPVLILSDLGCLEDSDGICKAWLNLGRRLQKSGTLPVVLSPCPKRLWRAELSGFFARVGWDVGQRVPRRVEKRHMIESETDRLAPDRSTHLLLTLLSCAIRVEPALLRAVRCLIGPDQADAGSEAGFWNHADILPNPVACSYANRDSIADYRKAFQAQPKALQNQVIRTIAKYHAGLPEEIRNEEQRIAAALFGKRAPEQEKLMRSFLKSYFEDPDNADYRAWVLRMAERQHGDIWQNSEALTAIWVKAHEQDLKSGQKLEIPEGLDVSSASWVLAGSQKKRRFRIDQAGQALGLRAEEDSDPPAAGSPVGTIESLSGMLQVVIETTQSPRQGTAFDCSKSRNRIPLPESASIRIATECDELRLETLLKPDWAEAMGRDRHGLFAVLPETSGGRRLYWMNPGWYPAAGREVFLKTGFFIDAAEYRSWLEQGFEKPEWADDFGVDEYGMYAIFKFKNVAQTMRWIPPGSFTMGSPEDEPERRDGETPHEVLLTRGFWLADSACTQALWEAVMGNTPIMFKGPDRPVENVSWDEAQALIMKINAGRPGLTLRMPSEAEWEYACRAGTITPFWFGDNIRPEQVNYNGGYPYAGAEKGQYRGQTLAVKSLPCNGWGLYEMHGNVWEWCQDCYGEYNADAMVDPASPLEGGARVLRGGSWSGYAGWTRSAYRVGIELGYRDSLTGFRLARGQSSGSGGAQQPEISSPGQAQRSGAGRGLRGRVKRFFKK
ncbi:MAG: formylglycine-generating enzyme family protein [Methylococcaceae bacterium]|nr:formylglycine-generating enzyme family protein [Methylococcaceae bacterium]